MEMAIVKQLFAFVEQFLEESVVVVDPPVVV